MDARVDFTKSTNEKVANAIDLETIEENIENTTYRCWESFEQDIKWIAHNIKSQTPSEHEKSGINWLVKFTRNELYSIRLCHECYKNANDHPANWFLMVCEERHPVVWAKLDTYPYWPAKLMACNESENMVDVRFFGDNEQARVMSSFCTTYTKHCPSINFGDDKDAWDKAQSVSQRFRLTSLCPFVIVFLLFFLVFQIEQAAKLYIDNLTAKCGPNVMSNLKIPNRRQSLSASDFRFVSPSTLPVSGRISKRRSTVLDRTPKFTISIPKKGMV